VTITGSTRPRVRHARILIGYAATTGQRRGMIGAVTTTAKGTFAVSWRPPASGTYTITSDLPRPPRGLLPDHNCDLALTVTR
jgi:hypothetical protein